jgi:hypothetical protein
MSFGTTNTIKEVKNVDSENFDYLLAETNFRIDQVFRSRNKAIIEPTIPIISAPVSSANYAADYIAFNSSKTKPGSVFSFIIDANDYTLFDLRDAEFDIQAQYRYLTSAKNTGAGNGVIANNPRFGNLALLSLFQQIELYIDGTSIERNLYPGMNANMIYALKYPHCKTLESTYEINGFNKTMPYLCDYYDAQNNDQAVDALNILDNQSITIGQVQYSAGGAGARTRNIVSGFITQRIKLSDIFACIETLPPLYNHKVEIKFTRASHNYIICNTCAVGEDLQDDEKYCGFMGFTKFKMFQDTYVTTDQYINTAKQYYSTVKETIITQDKQVLVPLITQPTANQTQSFNINVDAAFKNKLLTIYIPRTSSFAYQPIEADTVYDANGRLIAVDNTKADTHIDVRKAPANSYITGNLRYLSVSTTAGLKLYEFDMENDGVVECGSNFINKTNLSSQLDYNQGTIKIMNYQDAYKQYVKARLHFQQSEEEAIDFDMFCKEYCVYCIDLSCFQLAPNESLKITITTGAWNQQNTAGTANVVYNPFFFNNNNAPGNRYQSTAIIADLFCDQVLRLIPDRRVELATMITTDKKEVENSNMA